MFCRKCGHELPENGKFCPACGTPVKTDSGSFADPESEKQKEKVQSQETIGFVVQYRLVINIVYIVLTIVSAVIMYQFISRYFYAIGTKGPIQGLGIGGFVFLILGGGVILIQALVMDGLEDVGFQNLIFRGMPQKARKITRWVLLALGYAVYVYCIYSAASKIHVLYTIMGWEWYLIVGAIQPLKEMIIAWCFLQAAAIFSYTKDKQVT